MPPFSEPPPDRPDPAFGDGLSPSDLDVLSRDPSLATLARRGWQLDGLPTASVAWAFLAALVTSVIAFGPLASAPLVAASLIPFMLAVCGLLAKDVAAVRSTLRIARIGFLLWALLNAVCL